jgi:hypothetical protein
MWLMPLLRWLHCALVTLHRFEIVSAQWSGKSGYKTNSLTTRSSAFQRVVSASLRWGSNRPQRVVLDVLPAAVLISRANRLRWWSSACSRIVQGSFLAWHGAEDHWRIHILLYTLHRRYTVRTFSAFSSPNPIKSPFVHLVLSHYAVKLDTLILTPVSTETSPNLTHVRYIVYSRNKFIPLRRATVHVTFARPAFVIYSAH